jgi:hypothetical protein
MTRIAAIAALAASMFLVPQAKAFGGSWQCENQMDRDQDEAREIAGTNNAMFNVLVKLRDRWDIQHMRKQCEAYAAGEPYEISCLNDRRDWEAIKNMVPSEWFGMSTLELAPHFQAMESTAAGLIEVGRYCRDVGAIE